MRKWYVVCLPVLQRQRDSQADGEKTVSVCESHCEGVATPHSAVNRLNTRRPTRRHASQCTQESVVKYRGEALSHTEVAGLAEVQT